MSAHTQDRLKVSKSLCVCQHTQVNIALGSATSTIGMTIPVAPLGRKTHTRTHTQNTRTHTHESLYFIRFLRLS